MDIVCKKGNILLWNTIQDDDAANLSEGLINKAEKLPWYVGLPTDRSKWDSLKAAQKFRKQVNSNFKKFYASIRSAKDAFKNVCSSTIQNNNIVISFN